MEVPAIGAMLADGNRATMLLELLDGRALPASELASRARISRPLASMHLGKLEANGLIRVEPSGRHRYYRLTGPELAAALEALAAVAAVQKPRGGLREHAAHGALRYARSCYDHLAGELGVQVTERLMEQRALEPVEAGFAVTPAGGDLLAGYGIESTHRPRSCGRQIASARRSAIATVVRFVLARGIVGMIEASATNNCSTPKTRPESSTTRPIPHVPAGWK